MLYWITVTPLAAGIETIRKSSLNTTAVEDARFIYLSFYFCCLLSSMGKDWHETQHLSVGKLLQNEILFLFLRPIRKGVDVIDWLTEWQTKDLLTDQLFTQRPILPKTITCLTCTTGRWDLTLLESECILFSMHLSSQNSTLCNAYSFHEIGPDKS